MPQEATSKIQCKAISQVGIAVKNLVEVARNYWEILGIGPWAIFNWEPPLVYDRKYHGKASPARERIAVTQVGDLQLELVQPIEGDSIYQDWINERGEGLHHLNFLVDDVDETAEKLLRQGFPSIQSGRFGQGNAFEYIDIKPLRAIWEPVHVGEDVGGEPLIYPDITGKSPARIECKAISQVGVSVE